MRSLAARSTHRRLAFQAVASLLVVLLGLGSLTSTADAMEVPGPTSDQYDEVRRLYLAYFEREPDIDGAMYWLGLYWSGRTLSSISQEFAQSPEFRARYGQVTNEGFVRLVYNNVLDRDPDHAGLTYWSQMMNQGGTRGWVMIGFSNSAEFRARTAPGALPIGPAPPDEITASWVSSCHDWIPFRKGDTLTIKWEIRVNGEPVATRSRDEVVYADGIIDSDPEFGKFRFPLNYTLNPAFCYLT